MDLSQFQTPNGFFAIAAFDHRASLAHSLDLNLQNSEHVSKFMTLKRLFMRVLSPHVSAVLTDPEYGIETLAEKAATAGLFLSLEESGYEGDKNAMTTLRDNWGIDGVKGKNAGAKLLMYFNSKSDTANQKISLAQQLYQEAHDKKVPLFIEPLLHEMDGAKQWDKVGDDYWIDAHLDMCRSFAPLCDILKIQYPGNTVACEEVSIVHENWVLLSRGDQYELFQSHLKDAMAVGCKGFAAGRAVWQELTTLKTEAEWEAFLSTTVIERLAELEKLLVSTE